ncbi:hypothetical protein GWG65_27935 [Bradyrhizobium sp. CSA207]|nr:hypothetical protein [Bradyrhizobium sp. CSA207]
MWIDATCVRVRQQGRNVSVAGIVAIIVQDGRPEIPGMDVGPSADGVPAQARQAGSARPQASESRTPTRHQGGRQGAERHVTALPSGGCRKEFARTDSVFLVSRGRRAPHAEKEQNQIELFVTSSLRHQIPERFGSIAYSILLGYTTKSHCYFFGDGRAIIRKSL